MERDTFWGVVILLGILVLGIGYVSFAGQILLVPADETIDYLEERSCPDGMFQCSAGGFTKDYVCCRTGLDTCASAFGWPFCNPIKKESCPCGEKFCSGSKSNACCNAEKSECAVNFGYAVCKNKNHPECSGAEKCGDFLCCDSNERCISDPAKICSANRCPAGEELCEGRKWNICCPIGTCAGKSRGQTVPTCNVPACPPEPPECDEEAVYDPDCDRPGIDEENEDILE